MNWKDKFNIQLFAEGEGAGAPAGTDPTSGAGDGTTPQTAGEGTGTVGQQIEVPEYLSSYIEGIQDTGQKEYLQSLLADEKGLGVLKNFIPDPNAEWTIKADDYKDMTDDVAHFITAAKEQGIPESVAKHQLEARRNYLATEKAKMTPEQIALEPVINNFIGAEKDVEIQNVYARLSENAAGRKVLQKIIELSNPATTSITGGSAGTPETYDHNTFVEAYNEAKPVKGEVNKQKLRALETFARNSSDSFFKDFLGIK